MSTCQIKDGKYFAPNGNESQLYKDLTNVVGEEKAKDLFIFAYSDKFNLTPVKNSYVKRIGNTLSSFSTTFQNLNYKIKKVNGFETIQMYQDGKRLGYIRLKPFKDGLRVESSLLSEGVEKGQGLGTELYKKAIMYAIINGKSLYSDTSQSLDASKVWNKIESLGIVKQEEGRYKVDAYPTEYFDKNGEPRADKVLESARQQNEVTEPLSSVERMEIGVMLTQFPNMETSDDLLIEFEKAFYRNGLFNPTKTSLTNVLYSEYEAENLLSDVKLLNQVKTNIEKLKNTDVVENSTVLDANIKTNEINLFGKFKTLNPYIVKQDIIEEFGGIENPDLSEVLDKTITEEYLSEFSKIPVIDDNGNPVLDKVVYENATKVFEDISDLTPEKLINHGININNTDVVDSILSNPSISNILSQNDGAPQRQETVKVRTEGRDLVYLETFKNEEQLFNELSLVQTNTPNVYHRIEKVDEQELRSFLNNNESPEYQLYKDYYGYTSPTVEETSVTVSPITTNIEYLKGDFIADFNIEILKNPNHEFYNKFEVNEKGISLKYNDPISISQIKAYISDNIKLGKELSDYSVISKNIPNLKEEVVEDDRITAVNNINSLKKPTSQVTQVDNNTVLVKNESENFINYKNDVYELKNKEGNNSVYTKLNVVKDLNYYQVEVETQEYTEQVKVPQQSLQKYSTINKLYKKSDIEDNFSCVG